MAHVPVRCETCQFWQETGLTKRWSRGAEVQHRGGQCRVGPPQFLHSEESTTQGYWPLTLVSDWCGAHKPDPNN